jgi:phage replication O-like protein O
MMSGTTAIPNEFIEGLMSKKLGATELQVAMALARLTWGEDRPEVQVTLARLADMTGTGRTTVSHALSRLAGYGIVTAARTSGSHAGNVYGLVADSVRWDNPPIKMPELRIRIFRRDRYRCVYCGRPDPGGLTLDHVVPKFLGGSGRPLNLVTSCERCNIEKSSVGLAEFFHRHPDAKHRLGPLLDLATVLPPPPLDAFDPARPGPQRTNDEDLPPGQASGESGEFTVGSLPSHIRGGMSAEGEVARASGEQPVGGAAVAERNDAEGEGEGEAARPMGRKMKNEDLTPKRQPQALSRGLRRRRELATRSGCGVANYYCRMCGL